MSSFKECDKHGRYEVQYREWKLGKEIKKTELKCPECEKEYSEKMLNDALKECEGFRDMEIRNCLASIMMPVRYRKLNIFDMAPSNEKQAEIIERCKKYIDKFAELKKLGTSLVFTGMPGTGKTHIALSMITGIVTNMLNEICEKNIQRYKDGESDYLSTCTNPCIYINTYDLFAKIKATYNKNNSDTELCIMEKYSNVELLILDEVGVQSGSDYESTIMFRIINSRYENMKPTFLISNLSEEDLSQYIGERTIDRFYENHGAVFVFDWESHRRS